MKIGFITQWYPPEHGSAALPGTMTAALADQGHSIDVVTAYPNYPDGVLQAGWRQRLSHTEGSGRLRVHRTPIYISHDERMRRHHAGQHVTEAHREHIYQHLVDDAHLSHTHVATIHATAAVGIALATHFMSARMAAPVIALIASGYLASPMLARRWQRRFDGPASLDLPHNTTIS